jgi:hypothetical protein
LVQIQLPGRGWITVRAEDLTTAGIMSAIEKGDFYASTGVELEDYKATQSRSRSRLKKIAAFRQSMHAVHRKDGAACSQTVRQTLTLRGQRR